MKIGIDLDGYITNIGLYKGKIKLPWWIIFVGIILLWPITLPKKDTLLYIKAAVASDIKIIIISLRPKELEWITKLWLRLHKIPYDKLILLGVGKGHEERKLKALQEEEIKLYLDDNKKTNTFLRSHGIATSCI